MNPIDDQLDRLFRLAQNGAPDVSTTPPYGLETRVLAAWRESRSPSFLDTGLLVKGLFLAVAIMGLSLWPVLGTSTNPYEESMQMAESPLSSWDGTL